MFDWLASLDWTMLASCALLGLAWVNPCCCGCFLCSDDFERAVGTDVSTGSLCGWIVDPAGSVEIVELVGESGAKMLRFKSSGGSITSTTARLSTSGSRLEGSFRFSAVGDIFIASYAKPVTGTGSHVQFKLINATTVEITASGSTDPPRTLLISNPTTLNQGFSICWQYGVGQLLVILGNDIIAFPISAPSTSHTRAGFSIGTQGIGTLQDNVVFWRTDLPGCGCGVACVNCRPDTDTTFSVPITITSPGQSDFDSDGDGIRDCTTAECAPLGGGFILIQSELSPCLFSYTRVIPQCAELCPPPPDPCPDTFFTYELQFIQAGGIREQQTITITGNPTGGSFKLSFSHWGTTQTTAAIPYNATLEQVQLALGALTNIGEEWVIVSSAGPLPGNVMTVIFLFEEDLAQLIVANNDLTGGINPQVTISTTTQGVNGGRVTGSANISGIPHAQWATGANIPWPIDCHALYLLGAPNQFTPTKCNYGSSSYTKNPNI